MREPACWEMHWLEVSVLDGNANALGIADSSLMDAAGMALAVTAREMADGPIVFLCGPGNNGGDGFVAARYLRKWGIQTTVLASHPESRGEEPPAPNRGSRRVGFRTRDPRACLRHSYRTWWSGCAAS